jgi:hypothetical protein
MSGSFQVLSKKRLFRAVEAEEDLEGSVWVSGDPAQFLALTRERDELAPSLRPEPPRPRLEREAPGLEW